MKVNWGIFTCVPRVEQATALALTLRGQGASVSLFTDPKLPGGVTEHYVSTWAMLAGDPGDWCVVVEDDVVLVDDFASAATSRLMEAQDAGLLCLSFYSARKEVPEAAQRGETWARIPGAAFRNTQAVAMRTPFAGQWAAWAERIRQSGDYRHWYDVLLADFLHTYHLPMWLTVPSLVDHRQDLPSLLGHPRTVRGKPRKAALFMKGLEQ